LKLGQQGRIQLPHPGLRPEVDPLTRTVAVDVAIPNADLRFKPGAFATVELEVGADRDACVVRASAVRSFAGVRKVYVVAEGEIVERVVSVGRAAGDRIEITTGLKRGDMYVAAPPAGLTAGTRISADGS
jgi:multidrug efflux pump subunit AcrA (membrane-fusion protein)